MVAFSLGKKEEKKEKVEINPDDYADYGDYLAAKRAVKVESKEVEE